MGYTRSATAKRDIEPPASMWCENVTDMYATCPGHSRPPTNRTWMPCIINIGCVCSITTRQATLLPTQTLRPCNNFTAAVDVRHAVNLAVLKSFYDLANSTLTGKTLWSPDQVPINNRSSCDFSGRTPRNIGQLTKQLAILCMN